MHGYGYLWLFIYGYLFIYYLFIINGYLLVIYFYGYLFLLVKSEINWQTSWMTFKKTIIIINIIVDLGK